MTLPPFTAMSNPLVSVVMVVCNVERFLGEAIASVLAQTFREFEFVIVDFGSTDKSKEIVSQYAATDHRIRLHEIPNCGLAEARNAGVSRAQGRYVAIMDADDVSLPDRLLREVEFLEKNPNVGVVGGAVAWIDATGSLLGTPRYPRESRSIVRSGMTSFSRPCSKIVRSGSRAR